ncbi:MAG: acyltransferase family protein [Promethearchaeota archaeon]|jgi:hypothetical protein
MESKYSDELTFTETEKERSEDNRFFQVDVLKAAMIFLVIFDHIVSWGIKRDIGVSLWERISIPVFLIIMGFNMGKSFQGKGDLTLKELYSWSYFKNKILRYVVPFLILYAASTVIGLFMYNFDFIAMYDGQNYPNHGIINLFVGFLPFWGPGNWFIPVILSAILIFPLLYKGFKKAPVFTLILCLVIEIYMQLIVFFFIGEITSWEEAHILSIFMTNVLFYLFAIGLGMWFSFDYKLQSNHNTSMWFLYPISLAYIITYQFFGFRFVIGDVLLVRGDYHFLFIPYSAFIFLLALKFIPKKAEGRIARTIKLISKSTYHILLIQILGYGMVYAYWGTHYALDIPFTLDQILDLVVVWIIFVSFGIVWYKIDQQKSLFRRGLYYLNLFIIFSSVFFFTFWIQSFWVPLPLLIILVYAVSALITHFVIKRPLNTKMLVLWTWFLLITFVMLILQVSVLPPTEFGITLIVIWVFLIVAMTGTLLVYNPKKLNN